jgi:ubiquinone/menaquinone biosynthesis C-methylase UbiE
MKPAFDDYDARAAHYGQHVATYRDPALTLAALESLPLALPMRALDLGAGQGDGSAGLRALGAAITYADRNKTMLDAGVARGIIPEAAAVVCDLRAVPYPFPSSSFDVIIARYVLHDIPTKAAVCTEIERLLTPGGTFQMIDMCVADPALLPFYNALHERKTLTAHRPCWIVDQSSLEAVIVQAGLYVHDCRWYYSRVSSRDWYAEGQITTERHAELLAFVSSFITSDSALAEYFGITITGDALTMSLPVVIVTARKPA